MASNNEEEMDPETQEAMIRQVEDLQLQQKRMKALVAQRREERLVLEKDLARMERMKKHMEVMCKENMDVAEAEQKAVEAKKPFSGLGQRLGANVSISPSSTSTCSRPIIPPPPPIEINPALPTTSIQVIYLFHAIMLNYCIHL